MAVQSSRDDAGRTLFLGKVSVTTAGNSVGTVIHPDTNHATVSCTGRPGEVALAPDQQLAR
ncbi:MAG: hypothetical protein V5A28_07720 [Haloarculaceae archaeon]